jgi:MscS family membrane protein
MRSTLCSIAFLLILGAVSVEAQGSPQKTPTPNSHDPLNRDSPQSAAFSFLEASHSKNYARAVRYLDLRSLPEDKRLHDGPDLARQLAQVLDRDTRFDVASLSRERDGDVNDALPQDRELVDSFDLNGRAVQLQLEHATLRSGLQVWLFAPESIDLIPRLAATTSDSPIEKHLPPQLVNWKLMDTSLWRWIATALVAVVLGTFSRWIARLMLFVIDMILKRTARSIDRGLLCSFTAPLQLLLPVVMFRAALPALGLSALFRLAVERLLVLLLFLGIAWLSIRIVDAFILGVRALLVARKSTFSYSAFSLVSHYEPDDSGPCPHCHTQRLGLQHFDDTGGPRGRRHRDRPRRAEDHRKPFWRGRRH